MVSPLPEIKMTNCCSSIDNIEVVILSGSKDFGRCPIASRLPVALWPVLQKPAVERVIDSLCAQGIKDVCVCSEGDIALFRELLANNKNIQIRFFEEPLRAGTAGCIRDSIYQEKKDKGLVVAVPAVMIFPPDINNLICAHLKQKADLTAVFNPCCEEISSGTSVGVYICGRNVLENIPEDGYCDIKEWLVPELVRYGKSVKALDLACDVGNFRDGPGYLRAMADYLEKGPILDAEIPSLNRREGQYLWIDETAEVDPSAKFYGRVVVMAGAKVAEGVVVFGPSIIGRNCRISRESVVVGSVLWDNSEIGANCQVQKCLLDYSVKIPNNRIARYRTISFKEVSAITALSIKVSGLAEKSISFLQHSLGQSGLKSGDGSVSVKSLWRSKVAWLAGAAVFMAFLWSYWPIVADLWNVWQRSDEYSSGLLVPFLAVYVLWSRRERLKDVPIKPLFWALPILFLAEGLRLFGLFFMFGSAERLSVVICIIALAVFLLGWEFFKKTAFVFLFLLLMLPWPQRVQQAVSLPLQSWSTSSAVFCLEMIGYNVIQEGNIIHINQTSVAVAEACNGLRMVTAFFVITGLVVLLVRRRRWEKLIVLASSLPIALLCNTIRLAITAIAFTILHGDYWEKIFHDFGGYAMMPVALAAVIAELWVLRRLTVIPDKTEAVIITR